MPPTPKQMIQEYFQELRAKKQKDNVILVKESRQLDAALIVMGCILITTGMCLLNLSCNQLRPASAGEIKNGTNKMEQAKKWNNSMQDYTVQEICHAIFRAEGGEKANAPYGILSVKVKDTSAAKRICIQSIKKNRIRYLEYKERKGTLDYIGFISRRWAPLQASNDPKGLNKNFEPNLRLILAQNRREK